MMQVATSCSRRWAGALALVVAAATAVVAVATPDPLRGPIGVGCHVVLLYPDGSDGQITWECWGVPCDCAPGVISFDENGQIIGITTSCTGLGCL